MPSSKGDKNLRLEQLAGFSISDSAGGVSPHVRLPGARGRPVPLSAVLELRSAATFAPRPTALPLGHASRERGLSLN